MGRGPAQPSPGKAPGTPGGMKILPTLTAFILLLLLAGTAAWALTPSDVKVAGEVYAYDALVPQRTLVALPSGDLTLSLCPAAEVQRLNRLTVGRCIVSPATIGDGTALVKSVRPAYRAQVQAAMTRSITYSAVDLRGGLVVQ